MLDPFSVGIDLTNIAEELETESWGYEAFLHEDDICCREQTLNDVTHVFLVGFSHICCWKHFKNRKRDVFELQRHFNFGRKALGRAMRVAHRLSEGNGTTRVL